MDRFAKWSFVRKYGLDPRCPAWTDEYACLLENGRGSLKNSSIPPDVWKSLAASTHRSSVARDLANYVANVHAERLICMEFVK